MLEPESIGPLPVLHWPFLGQRGFASCRPEEIRALYLPDPDLNIFMKEVRRSEMKNMGRMGRNVLRVHAALGLT